MSDSAHEGGGGENLASGAGASATVMLNGTSSIDGNTVGTTFGGYGAGIDNTASSGGTASVTLNSSSQIATNSALASGSNGGLAGGKRHQLITAQRKHGSNRPIYPVRLRRPPLHAGRATPSSAALAEG